MFLFIVVDYNAQRLANTNLNTSHVLIYPWLLSAAISQAHYLNTSHVLIYQSLHPAFLAPAEHI